MSVRIIGYVALGFLIADFLADAGVAAGIISAENPSIGTQLGTRLRNWWLRRKA